MREFKEKLRNNRWPLFFAILIISVLAIRYYSNIRERNELAVKAGNWDKLMLVMKQIDENYVDSIKYDEITETSRNTNILNRSPLSTTPFIPAIIRQNKA